MNKVVHVLDSIPGTRKTTGAIKYINNNPSKPILYICEYKSEIDRVCNETHCVQPESVYDETLEKYHSKRDNIKKLLVTGQAIASSHSLFINFDEEILSVIEKLGYEIILDEVVEPIYPLNSCYTKGDYKALAAKNLIEVDETGKIIWKWDEVTDDTAYSGLKKLSTTNQIFKAGKLDQFLHVLPIGLFSAASKVTVMTYNFKGSHLYQYLKIHGFEVLPEKEIKASDDKNLRQHIKDHVVICRHKGTDKYREKEKSTHKTNGNTLSYSNYIKKRHSKDFRKFIGGRINLITRYLLEKHNQENLSVSEVMYTFPMSFSGVENIEKEVKGKVIKKKVYVNDPKNTISVVGVSALKCFVPFNCRGTNEYSDKAILIHCYNQFVNPLIKSYYNTYTDVDVNEDDYALNTLVQWIFRSRIRKYVKGEKVYVYCLSERMEIILEKWLESL